MVKSIYDQHYVEIVSRLRASREHAQISQAELAQRVGRPQSFISKIETCERRLDLVEALVLCAALGIQLEAIVPTDLGHLLRNKHELPLDG